MDPEARRLLAEAAAAGGVRALEAVCQSSPVAEKWLANLRTGRKTDVAMRARQHAVLREMHKLFEYGSLRPVPRLSIAADASRVGGEKTMVFFFTWLEEQIVSWPGPQIIRDFAVQADAEASTLGATARDRWVYGMKNFFEDLSATHWWASAAQKEPSARPDLPDASWAKVPRPARLSSHDFLVALENCLRGAGLTLSSFASLSCISRKREAGRRAGGLEN